MKNNTFYIFLLLLTTFASICGQNSDALEPVVPSFENAHALAFNGKSSAATLMLRTLEVEQPENAKVKSLLASTLSWEGNYDIARLRFSDVLSKDKLKPGVWISAVKNELYAKNYHTALGLSNKALKYVGDNQELERLRTLAKNGIFNLEYTDKGWHNVESVIETSFRSKKPDKKANENEVKDAAIKTTEEISSKTTTGTENLVNRVAVSNSVTVFDQRYDAMTFASLSFMRQTSFGSIIPRINYGNRFGENGIQYDIDLYPKIAKGLYAYINYGFSNSEIYPKHKVGGDLFYNFKNGIEFSAGGRFISFPTRDVKVVTNSLGYYKGNYYFSLRSYITPVPNGLTRASGNLLVRKYLKDAENFIGVSGGFGFSPELRQFTSGDQILAETLLYIESQRLSCEYQFTGRNNLNTYRTNIGVMRQELSFAPGSFFWSFSAGLTYEIEF